VNYDDETLMAYADGELDEAQRAAIAMALEKDPELARRVQRHRALRAEVAGAFAKVIDQPVPERLVTAARGTAAATQQQAPRRDEVLQFPARTAAVKRWGVPQWGAMAASLVLGVLISWRLFAPPESIITARDGALVARGMLANALDRQLADQQAGTDPVHIGVSFRNQEGGYCRSFALRTAGTAGLACRIEGEWRIPVTESIPVTGELRQAASLTPAVLRAIEARISGEPLSADGEASARRAGWSSGN
jgi:hypothetical protein